MSDLMSTTSPTTKTQWTISELLRWTATFLEQQGVDEPRLAGEVLLARAAGCQRIDLYARFDRMLPPEQVACFRGWVRRAADQEPIALIVGEKEFFSLPFVVTPDVLIPRPETETLVECAIDHCRNNGLTKPRVLEIGTGSGCVAVALLANVPEASVVATDVSTAALAVAQTNAERHAVTDRLTLVEADKMDIPVGVLAAGGFDLLLSNPPYVRQTDLATLDACVRDYEPETALTDGDDGLCFYRAFAAGGGKVLTCGGLMMVEIGDGMASDVVSTICSAGGFMHLKTCRDRVVGLDRVVVFSVRV